MKTRRATTLLIAVTLAAGLASCGGKKTAAPTEVFKNFYTAARNKDVAGLKSMMSRAALADTEREAQEKGQSLDEFLAARGRFLSPNLPEIRNEKVEGDKASLEFRREGAANWSTAWFVKEDGVWKVNFN